MLGNTRLTECQYILWNGVPHCGTHITNNRWFARDWLQGKEGEIRHRRACAARLSLVGLTADSLHGLVSEPFGNFASGAQQRFPKEGPALGGHLMFEHGQAHGRHDSGRKIPNGCR